MHSSFYFRGHNIIWNVDYAQPEWVNNLTDRQVVETAAFKRVEHVPEYFKGRSVISPWPYL